MHDKQAVRDNHMKGRHQMSTTCMYDMRTVLYDAACTCGHPRQYYMHVGHAGWTGGIEYVN
jgi:hypothetical protein